MDGNELFDLMKKEQEAERIHNQNENLRYTLNQLKKVDFMTDEEFKKVFMGFFISYSLSLLDRAPMIRKKAGGLMGQISLVEELSESSFKNSVFPIVQRYLIDNQKIKPKEQ